MTSTANRPTHGAGPDVLIVGGGVIGCSVAYFLGAEHGLRCTIVERDDVAMHASGYAAGELNPLGRTISNETFTRFCIEGLRLHRGLAPALLEEGGDDYQLTDFPAVQPAFDPVEVEEGRRVAGLLSGYGFPARWIDAPELQAMRAGVAGHALGALRFDESQVDTKLFATVLAAAARNHGVTVLKGEATGLVREGDRVTGITLKDGTPLSAGLVVVANGPWARMAGGWMGLEVPVVPVRGQIVYLDPGDRPPEHIITHLSGFVRPKANGSLLVGTTEEEAGFDPSVTQRATDDILARTRRLAPATERMKVRHVTACLRPVSLDGLPFIGAVPTRRNLFIATGHGRKGIAQCLATGKYLAQIMVRAAADYPMDAFSPARLRPAAG
ncbi:MAG: FAD-dependent oxidoreductase [SAR202 cluster bacterium]|nr:FAD-dependent oxidoreductase [SAR202 cluster bacterium]